MTKPKKHHFVPQSLLREFSIDDRRQQIVVFDKTQRESYVSSITDAGSENYFNTVELEGRRFSFEGLFQTNDDELGRILKLITKTQSLASLNHEARIALPEIVAVQLIRTKMSRTTMIDFATQLRRTLAKAGLDESTIDEMGIPTDNDARIAILSSFLDSTSRVESLKQKDIILIRGESESPIWISDNPVVTHNSFPYGELGLESPGVEVYMPISSQLALGFFCSSIKRRLSAMLDVKLPSHLHEQFLAIRHGLDSGVAVSLGSDTSKFLNTMQVHRSSRFLYAARDEFGQAKKIIDRKPELRDVQSIFTFGELGQGPPRNPRMPPGRWVVIYGREDHHLIRVDRWIEDSVFIEFVTSDLVALLATARDMPLVQAQYFEDGQAQRLMREIQLEVIGEGTTRRVIVKHNNDGLNAMLVTT